MDMDLKLITDTYNLFAQYNIYIPSDDYDKVEGLQVSFNKMLDDVSTSLSLIFNKLGLILISLP